MERFKGLLLLLVTVALLIILSTLFAAVPLLIGSFFKPIRIKN